ncbi:MAG: hypothetical protein WCF92_01645 [bacterium]
MTNIKFTKPSRKIISLIIVVVALISSILFIKYGGGNIGNPSSLTYSVTDINSFNEKNQTNDTQSLNDLLGIGDSTSTDTTDNANTSDLVSRSLYAGYLSLSQNGDSSADSQKSLASGIASQAVQAFTYDTFSPENLKIISSPSKEEIKFYATSLATIQNNILADMAKESSLSKNIQLTKISQIYKNAAKNVYDLPVPVDIANSSLNIANNYNIVSSVYNNLANADKDPVTATISLKYFQQAEVAQRPSINALANYFQDSGIIFTSDDVGIYWNQFVTNLPSSSR